MRTRTGCLATVVGLLLWGGCSPREPVPRADAAATPLVASLEVEPRGGQVQLRLQVTNVSDRPLELQFNSGQSFDFVVSRGGREVWRWSAEQMFTQALRSQTLPPGETLRFEAVWTPPAGSSGEHTVMGVLTATNQRVEQSARFQLP